MARAFRVSAGDLNPQWCAVNQDIPSNSVIVRNLSPSTREETIIIHFQKKRNGGGEVDRVRLLSEGVAVVRFEKPEVVDSVLAKSHEIEGALVTLERHQIPSTDQVFGKVAGRLNPSTLGLSFYSMEEILRTIQEETNVEWKKIFDGFVVSGTFKQIKRVGELLSCHLKKEKGHKSERTPIDSRRPLVRDSTTKKQSMVGSKVSTESTSLHTSAICRSDETICKATGRKYNKPSIPNENQVELTESNASKHGRVENERVRISKSAKKLDQPDVHNDVSNTRNDRKMQIQEETVSQSDGISRPTPHLDNQFVFYESNKEKASTVEQFKAGVVDNVTRPSRVSEFENTSANGERPGEQGKGQDQEQGEVKNQLTSVKQREIPLESSEGKSDRPAQPKRERLAGTLNRNVSCEDEESKSTLFNSSCNTEKTTLISPVLNEASDQTNQPCSHLENPKSDVSLTKGKDEYTVEENSLMYITSTDIKVLLQKGDITSTEVDVLLSPAGPTLSYKEGLSKLILEKGGCIMKEECRSITQAKCPLQYGITFFTSGGNLPCRRVLHAVLPPWIRDNENQKAYKRQIHKCLIEGLALASGHRHKSIAIPPLGQDGTCIPLEVSVEVITRVIATFSNNAGPMHTGINEIRIVCEDDPSTNEFAKELSSFSFRGDGPYFKMASSKNEFGGENKITKFQSGGISRANCDEGVDSSIVTEKSEEQIQKATSLPEKGSLPNREKAHILHTSHSKIETGASSQLNPQPDNAAILPVVNGKMKDASLNNSSQCYENTIKVISSSCTECTNITEANMFEILEATSTTTVELVEEIAKRVTAQDNSDRKVVNELNLKVDEENLEERNGDVAETGELLEKLSALKITKAMTPESQQPKPSPSLTMKQGTEIPGSDTRHFHRRLIMKDTRNLDPFQSRAHEKTDARSLNSPLFRMENGLFVTSPTVEALLNADLRLGVRGLQIEHERNRNIDKAESQGKESVLTSKQKQSNDEHFVSTTTSNEKQMITEKYFREDINENLLSKMVPAPADKGHKGKFTHGKKCDFKGTDGNKGDIDPALVDNYFNEDKRKVSTELPVSFLCALCQDTVDHPDFLHPNVCVKHKFCDDCILKAFTFSNNCPVCVDSYGLIAFAGAYNAANNHTAELDTKDLHLSVSESSSPIDQQGGLHWTAYPDAFKANQPPGQMMWKKYEESLPGFEGCGTVVVTFTFYDGTQSSEHPNPGELYKGMSCIAYLPDTQEGRQVLKVVRKAFDARLVFTVSRSASDPGHVALNGVELKTSTERNARNGYPDHGYLSRVRRQLAAKGFQ